MGTCNTRSTNDECCFDKKKTTRKRKERIPKKKYPETISQRKFDKNIFASHKHANSNSNVVGNSETVSTIRGVSRNMKAVNLKIFPNYGRVYSWRKIPDQSIELWKYFSLRSLLTNLTAEIGARLGLGTQLCFEAPDKLRVNIAKMQQLTPG